MRSPVVGKWNLGLALLVLPLAAGCLQQAASLPEISPPTVIAEAPLESTLQSAAEDDGASSAERVAEADLSNAAAKAVLTEQALPPTIRPGSPLAEVVRLADSGVDESVVLAFVTNSTSTFNLGSQEIIYLNDIGVPGAVIAAMIQRDHMLQQSLAVAAMAQPPAGTPTQNELAAGPDGSPPYPAPPETAAAPAEMAAPPYDAAESYPAPQPADASYSTFYDALGSYGTWADVEGYGRCWQPTVAVVDPSWRPYFDRGRWVYSDCGWYWLSDYSWGWAPFHYGRWFQHNRLGWCWVPEGTWGPSWVTWRYSGDYCGWSPLPPTAWFTRGLGLTYFGRPVGFGSNLGLSMDCYPFIPWNHFRDDHLRRYALPRHQVAQFYNNTVAVTRIIGSDNRVINRGITPERVAEATHTAIRPVVIRDIGPNAAGGIRAERLAPDGRTLAVFRPHSPPTARSLRGLADNNLQTGERITIPSGASPTVLGQRPTPPLRVADQAWGTRPQPNPGDAARNHVATDRQSAIARSSGTRADDLRDGGSSAGDNRPTIMPGRNRSAQGLERNATEAARETAQHNSLVIIGKQNVTRQRPLNNQYSAPSMPTPQLQPVMPVQPNYSRVTPNQEAQPVTAQAARGQTAPPSAWSPRQGGEPARFEGQQPAHRAEAPRLPSEFEGRFSAPPAAPQLAPAPRQFVAPVYQSPAPEVPRYAPVTPVYTPPAYVHSAPAIVSHPAPAAPAAPPAAAPSSAQAHSSSGRTSR